MTRKLPTLLGLSLLLVTATACASVNTEPDEMSIVYKAAMGSATTFSKCIGSAKRESVSVSENSWTYPAGQLTYDFTGVAGTQAKPMNVTSKDLVVLPVGGLVTFRLNPDCAVLRTFHESIGLRKRAFLYSTTSGDSDNPDEAGWNTVLNTYLRVPLDRALDAASKEFDARPLVGDATIKEQWEKRVGELARKFIAEASGGEFFCQPHATTPGCGDIVITLNQPEPPKALADAFTAEQAAKAQTLAQQQINRKVKAETESIKDLVDLLGPDGAVAWKHNEQLREILREAVAKGDPVITLPQGSGGINITTPKP
ncbi:SPFH domain-containing protein [Planomonospora sp. ID82291]|uniref:SPFH domain-containing protein n=1 Tax=Planomonospora sp. ID82291 TaxID=2738136 RepID=UPI0018C36ED5|nr:SPFH domain-containing protein [Planomonospora sp. ID82291]MBG0818263.1 hypothetical protein [Planomonospora sp. ID82291]